MPPKYEYRNQTKLKSHPREGNLSRFFETRRPERNRLKKKMSTMSQTSELLKRRKVRKNGSRRCQKSLKVRKVKR